MNFQRLCDFQNLAQTGIDNAPFDSADLTQFQIGFPRKNFLRDFFGPSDFSKPFSKGFDAWRMSGLLHRLRFRPGEK